MHCVADLQRHLPIWGKTPTRQPAGASKASGTAPWSCKTFGTFGTIPDFCQLSQLFPTFCGLPEAVARKSLGFCWLVIAKALLMPEGVQWSRSGSDICRVSSAALSRRLSLAAAPGESLGGWAAGAKHGDAFWLPERPRRTTSRTLPCTTISEPVEAALEMAY